MVSRETSNAQAMRTATARSVALRVLCRVEEQGKDPRFCLERWLPESGLERIHRAFAWDLVYGTLRWRIWLDYALDAYSRYHLAEILLPVRNILRMGAYQLLVSDRVPPWAAVDESVKLTRRVTHAGNVRLVNAILRRMQREGPPAPPPLEDLIDHLSIVYAHPRWMVERWLCRFGEGTTRRILGANNEEPRLTVRVNTLKASVDEVVAELESTGEIVERLPYVPEALRLTLNGGIKELPALRAGLVQVQDPSSMLASVLLDPSPGARVLDACAGLGGKSTHLAQLLGGRGEIVACDIDARRLELLEENRCRLGVDGIEVRRCDLRDRPDLGGPFSHVLLDAPCSGMGVLRRHPEARNTKGPGDVIRMAEVIQELLVIVAEYVEDGGVLVLSLCTFEPEETWEVVEEFLRSHSQFSIESAAGKLGACAQRWIGRHGELCVLPGPEGLDGFFAIRFRKRTVRGGDG